MYSESFETSKMELFAKIVSDFQPLTILAKSSILDVWQDYEYASDVCYSTQWTNARNNSVFGHFSRCQ